MEYYISPRYRDVDFPGYPVNLSLENKCEIFADREFGWRFEVALGCLRRDSRAAFAALAIAMTYFEMIAKYHEGYVKDKGEKPVRMSEHYFRKGFQMFILGLRIEPAPTPAQLKSLAGKVYADLRCELYHIGLTGRGIELTGQLDGPFQWVFAKDGQSTVLLRINPEKFIDAMEGHLRQYLRDLRDPAQEELRANFSRRFDYLYGTPS